MRTLVKGLLVLFYLVPKTFKLSQPRRQLLVQNQYKSEATFLRRILTLFLLTLNRFIITEKLLVLALIKSPIILDFFTEGSLDFDSRP